MIEARDVLPKGEDGGLLSPEQRAIGLNLELYYQFVAVGPTPKRLRMLLIELTKRAEANSAEMARGAQMDTTDSRHE